MKNNDNLNNILGLPALPDSTDISITDKDKENSIKSFTNEIDVESDVQFSRDNLRFVIQKGTEALEDILSIAMSSQRTEAFDSVANIMRALNTSNKELMLIHKTKREILEVKTTEENTDKSSGQHAEVINNNQLNLTTSQMLELLRSEKKNGSKNQKQ